MGGSFPGRERGLVSEGEEEELAFGILKHVSVGDVWAGVVWSQVDSLPFGDR